MNHKQSSDSDSEDSAVKNNGTALKKKGKFSNRESELIVKTVKDFIARWRLRT